MRQPAFSHVLPESLLAVAESACLPELFESLPGGVSV